MAQAMLDAITEFLPVDLGPKSWHMWEHEGALRELSRHLFSEVISKVGERSQSRCIVKLELEVNISW